MLSTVRTWAMLVTTRYMGTLPDTVLELAVVLMRQT